MSASDACPMAGTCYRRAYCDGPQACDRPGLVADVERRRRPDAVPDGFKWCATCGEVLPLSAFYRNRSRRDGLTNSCKECTRRNWRAAPAKPRARRGSQRGVPDGWQRCPHCGEVKRLTAENFYFNCKRRSGFASWCKACVAESRAASRGAGR